MNTLKRFLDDQSGLETVEWVVMGCVIVLGIVAVVRAFLPSIGEGVNAISNEIQTATEIGGGS